MDHRNSQLRVPRGHAPSDGRSGSATVGEASSSGGHGVFTGTAY